jgi:hypothetical protein
VLQLGVRTVELESAGFHTAQLRVHRSGERPFRLTCQPVLDAPVPYRVAAEHHVRECGRAGGGEALDVAGQHALGAQRSACGIAPDRPDAVQLQAR